MNTEIIGVAGLPRSGKDTLAGWLVEDGYYGVSLGDIVRNESKIRHQDKKDPISVANMTETANHLRMQYGADVVLKKALEQYTEASKQANYRGLVLYSVRTPVEADFILEKGGRLIWVEASDDIRYERALEFSRQGEMEGIDMDTFLAHEELQWEPKPGTPKNAQMNVAYVKNKATDTIENNENSLDKLQKSAQELIQQLR